MKIFCDKVLFIKHLNMPAQQVETGIVTKTQYLLYNQNLCITKIFFPNADRY